MTDLVMGVDSSTQSTTIEIREAADGRLVKSATSPHPPTHPPRSEVHPDVWWNAFVAAAAELGEARRGVKAVAIAGQQHGLVVIDGEDRVIRPAKLWNDTESAPQAAALLQSLDASGWARACGSVPLAAFTITKLAWLIENEPDNVDRIARIMLPHDWLTWRLAGVHVTDRGDASGTGWFDPAEGEYRRDLLGIVDERFWIDKLPHVLDATEPAGRLLPDAAAALGLEPDVVVGPGTGDNMAAALGLGLQIGDVAISLGTSGTAFAVSTAPAADPAGLVAGFADASGHYLPLVCTLNATRVTDTVMAWMGLEHEEFAATALRAPTGADGLVMVPYLDGERTPNLPNAAGMVSGIRTGTSASALARAAHEGVICGLLDGVDALMRSGIDGDGRLLLTGGGARSEAYRRVLADLAERPIEVPTTREVVAAGACLQAAAILLDMEPLDTAKFWGLGDAKTIEPGRPEAGARARDAYRMAAEKMAEWN